MSNVFSITEPSIQVFQQIAAQIEIPTPTPAAPNEEVGAIGTKLVNWTSWGLSIALGVGFMIGLIMMAMGAFNRGAMAAQGAVRLLWVGAAALLFGIFPTLLSSLT